MEDSPLVQSHTGTPVGVEDLLELNEGTVTQFLERLASEPVDVVKRTAFPVGADAANRLGLGEGTAVMQRHVVLRGRASLVPFLYARSLVCVDRVPDAVLRALADTDDPVGRILTDQCVAYTREPPVRIDATLPTRRLQGVRLPEGAVLARRYALIFDGVPAVDICEWFLPSVLILGLGAPGRAQAGPEPLTRPVGGPEG